MGGLRPGDLSHFLVRWGGRGSEAQKILDLDGSAIDGSHIDFMKFAFIRIQIHHFGFKNQFTVSGTFGFSWPESACLRAAFQGLRRVIALVSACSS